MSSEVFVKQTETVNLTTVLSNLWPIIREINRVTYSLVKLRLWKVGVPTSSSLSINFPSMSHHFYFNTLKLNYNSYFFKTLKKFIGILNLYFESVYFCMCKKILLSNYRNSYGFWLETSLLPAYLHIFDWHSSTSFPVDL